MTETQLAALGALAETLIPADDTPGADPAWARAFVARHIQAHPEEAGMWTVLAIHLDQLASAHGSAVFAALPVTTREAALRELHPDLVDRAELSETVRTSRRAMRELMKGFLTADELVIHSDPFARNHVPRDRTTPSTPSFATAGPVPDVTHDRNLATWVGTGTYARVWRAAGYASPPGLPPEDPRDVGRAPGDELVQVRKK
ncbi:hypothetical protein BH11MYX1_BH11MYX1_40410 [soil metagenome]